MLALKNLYIIILLAGIISLQLTGCSGNDTKHDYTVKTETKQPETPPKEEATASKEKEETAGESVEEKEAEEKEEAKDFMANKGIGPVKHVELGELDPAMAAEGKKIYEEKCTSCHKPDRRFVGPAQKGVLDRRSPEWVMNMILNPEQMIKEDPIAKQLLVDYNLSPMANQHLTREEARKILEYFRTL